MSTSILTNPSAMTALRSLQASSDMLGTLREQVATGLMVGTARDDAAIWAVSAAMRADLAATRTIVDSLGVAGATVSLARSAAELVVDRLQDARTLILRRDEGSGNGDSAAAARLGTQLSEIGNTVTSVLQNASFNGINLVAAPSTGSGDATFVIGESGRTVTVSNQGLNPTITASTTRAEVDAALAAAETAAATLGAAEGRLDLERDFNRLTANSLESGLGSLLDADMTEASMRLQALQVQEQLGVQAMSIANRAPESLLQLFR